MTGKFATRDLTAALKSLKPVDATSAMQRTPEAPMSGEERQKREELRVKMIAARVKLKLMRDRTENLKQALARFRTQRDAMRA